MNTRTYIAGGVAAVLTLALTACSPVSESDGTSADGGRTLTIASNNDPMSNLDRFVNYSYSVDDTGNLWADPLVTSDHQQHYEPAIATSWKSSKDGLTWTFQLREDITFSSGNPLTSADVKTTFERLVKDETLTDAGGWQGLDSVGTPDDHTAVIKLKAVMPTFLDEVGRVMILDSKAFTADPDGYFDKPSGTGAFTVRSFDDQTGEMVFAKNDDWWGWTSSNQTNVDTIDYKFISDDSTRASALQSGTVDVAAQLPADVASGLGSEYTVKDVQNDTHFHITYQTSSGKTFADENLREALSLSIDRDQLVSGILGGAGKVATWPVTEGNLGFKSGTSYAYDPDKAKQLVEASGYQGQPLDMLYSPSGFARAKEIAQAIQSMATQVGITLKLDEAEDATFQQRRSSGDYDITLGSFASTAGDPQTEVGVIIAHDVFGTGYDNEKLIQLANESQTITDRTERGEVLQQVFQIEFDHFAPFVYLYSAVTPYVMDTDVKNLTIYADGSAAYKFASVD
ncbi:ABC transporter substrate-binding protein [Isoptericola aurantiacus]|uniref:ABC transporter substrate-binding protein n=1 Tax=Isoptericola aurantiacus TaxID=3377839 RepID=UPI00383B5B4D